MKALPAGPPEPTVAVFDADAPTALAFTRSLGSRGVPVHVYSSHGFTVAGSSRFCAATLRCPSLDEPEAFLPWLEQQLRRKTIGCIAPTSDRMAYYLAELEGILPAGLQRVLPDATAVHTALFKDQFHAMLDRLGFPSPVTRAPQSYQEASEACRTMRFPVVVKPRSHVGAGLARGAVAADPTAALAAFRAWPEDKSNRLAFLQHPSLRLPLLQEYVPGALQHLYSISGIITPRGRLLAVSGSRKTSQWPPLLGIGVEFVPWLDPATIAAGSALARQVLGRGMFELEFIWDSARRAFLAIDLNPRAHGQISLDVARGHDLPWLWYRMFLGHSPPAPEVLRPDVRWRHGVPFHAGHVAHVARGPSRWAALTRYAQEARVPAVDVVAQSNDVLPGLMHAAAMLRHPRGLLRSLAP